MSIEDEYFKLRADYDNLRLGILVNQLGHRVGRQRKHIRRLVETNRDWQVKNDHLTVRNQAYERLLNGTDVQLRRLLATIETMKLEQQRLTARNFELEILHRISEADNGMGSESESDSTGLQGAADHVEAEDSQARKGQPHRGL